MSTKSAEKKGGAVLTADDEFLTYPIHNVVGVFDDREAAEAAVEELRSHGFAEKDIVIYHGTEGEDITIEHQPGGGELAEILHSVCY